MALPTHVSYIIPAHSADASLPRCLKALLSQDGVKSSEILVVDNAVTPTLAGSLAGWPVQVIHEPRLSPASARNAGLEAARGDVLVFVDADVVLEPTWTRTCLENLAWADCVQTPIEPIGVEPMLALRRALIGRNGSFSYLNQAKVDLPVLNTAAFMVRRDFVDRVRAEFDVRLTRCEDLDFGFQMFFSGARFALDSRSRAFVSDDRSLLGYFKRAWKNGTQLASVRNWWNLRPAKRSLQTRPSLAARFFIQVIDALTELGARWSRVEDEDKLGTWLRGDDRNVAVCISKEWSIAPYVRFVKLDDSIVLIDARSGARLVLTGGDCLQLMRALAGEGLAEDLTRPLRRARLLTCTGLIAKDQAVGRLEIEGLAKEVWLALDERQALPDLVVALVNRLDLHPDLHSRFAADVSNFICDLAEVDAVRVGSPA